MAKTQGVGLWMPIWIADMREDTAGFSLEFQGMYLNLLMAMWQNDGQLSDNEEYLSRLSGATPEVWIKHRQDLSNLFFPGDGYWMHNKLRQDLKRAKGISEARKASGTKANEIRWAKERAAKARTAELLRQIAKDGGAY